MKLESRIFEICTAFFFLCAIVYGFLDRHEVVGIVCLTLTGGLSLIIGTYFRFVSRRLELRPEDNPNAEVSDGSGDIGFFSPGSYWPVGVAAAASLLGVAVAYWMIWAIVIAVVALLFTIGGLLFEYHIPQSSH